MTLNNAALDLIDARVDAARARVTAMGTMTALLSDTRAMVMFDGSSVAVPVKTFTNVGAVGGDLVGLVKYGTDWVVVGCFTAVAVPTLTLGVIGGRKWTGGGDLVTGLGGTELSIMQTPTLTMPANSRVKITGKMFVLDTGSANTTYQFRIRDGSTTGGTQRGTITWKSPDILFGYNLEVSATHEIGASDLAQQYCITAQRLGGTGLLTMIAGGDDQDVYLTAEVTGWAGVVEMQATP